MSTHALLQCHQPTSSCQTALYKTDDTIRGLHFIDCNLTGCDLRHGETGGRCDLMECQCNSCAPIVTAMVETTLSGNPVHIRVDGNHIDMDVEGSFFPLGVVCNEVSACAVGDANSTSEFDDSVIEEEEMEEEETTGLVDKFQNDWRGATAVSIVMLFVIALVVLLVLGCLGCFYGRVRSNSKNDHGKTKGGKFYKESPDKPRILTFDKISMSVKRSNKYSEDGKDLSAGTSTTTILNNVSGSVEAGQVLGLLGASGSGKSSLLNALAGVPPQGGRGMSVSGKVLINNKPRDRRSFRQMSAYVQYQAADALFSTLTVRECLEYSAMLRLPQSMSTDDKRQRVDRALAQLQLTHVARCRIGFASSEVLGNGNTVFASNGDDRRGRISTGERRRVSIGMELVTSPMILFLDEPTTGLDSNTSNTIVSLLHELANQYGTMIIMSIHQPSAKAFRYFDTVLVLEKRGGATFYYGEASGAAKAIAKAGFPCPKTENIAEHLIDTASDLDSVERLHREGMLPITAKQRRSEQVPHGDGNEEENGKPLQEDNVEAQVVAGNNDVDSPSFPEGRSSMSLELQVLLDRTIKHLLRNQSLFLLHVLVSVVLATAAGLIFEEVTNDLAGFQNRTGAFYFTLIFFAISSMSSIDLFLAEERTIFLREAGAQYYGTLSYLSVKMVLDALTLRILPSTFYALILYFLIGFESSFYQICRVLGHIAFVQCCGG